MISTNIENQFYKDTDKFNTFLGELYARLFSLYTNGKFRSFIDTIKTELVDKFDPNDLENNYFNYQKGSFNMYTEIWKVYRDVLRAIIENRGRDIFIVEKSYIEDINISSDLKEKRFTENEMYSIEDIILAYDNGGVLPLREYQLKNGLLYHWGELNVGLVVYRDILYENEFVSKGIILFENVLFNDGHVQLGYFLYDDILYYNGLKSTGIVLFEGIVYIDGVKAKGFYFYNGILYYDSETYTGLYINPDTGKETLYVNGVINKGYFVYEDILYFDGIRTTGFVEYNEKIYNDGELIPGLYKYNGKLYNNGSLNIGYILYNNELYFNEFLNVGLVGFDGKLYQDSSFYENQTQLVIKDESNNDELYVYGLKIDNAVFPKTINELKIELTNNGVTDTIVTLPDLKHIYTGYVTSLQGIFYEYTVLENIDGIKSWNTSSVTIMAAVFYKTNSLKNIDALILWDVSSVISITGMFGYSGILNTDGLINWDISNIINMSSMFYNCENLLSLSGIRNFNLNSSINVSSLFYNCISIRSVEPLSNWRFVNVERFNAMFKSCISVEDWDSISNWSFPKGIYFNNMFQECETITNLNFITKWIFGKTAILNAMFLYCINLSDITGFNNISIPDVSDLAGLFRNCNKLGELEENPLISLFNLNITSLSTNYYGMIQNTGIKNRFAYELEDEWNTKNPSTKISASRMLGTVINFYFDNGLLYYRRDLYTGEYEGDFYINGVLDEDGYYLVDGVLYYKGSISTGVILYEGKLYNNGYLNTGYAVYDNMLYYGQELSVGLIPFEGKLYNDGLFYENQTQLVFKDESDNDELYVYGLKIDNAVFPKTRTELNTELANNGVNSTIITLPDLKHVYTGYITDFSRLFYLYKTMTNIDGIMSWDTGNVTTMERLFNQTGISNASATKYWNTSNVTILSFLFEFCYNLVSLDGLQNWDVSNVVNLQYMLRNCTNMVDITPLTNWDVGKVEITYNMFTLCGKILNFSALANWDTKNFTNISQMFYDCEISNVDFCSSWDTSNVTIMYRTFFRCSNLINISGLSNWNTSKCSNFSGMFAECRNLGKYSLRSLYNWNLVSGMIFTDMFTAANVSLENLELLIIEFEKTYPSELMPFMLDRQYGVGYFIYNDTLYLDGEIAEGYHTFESKMYYDGHIFNGVYNDIVWKNGIETPIEDKLFNSSLLLQLNKLVYKNNEEMGPLYKPSFPSFVSTSMEGKAADIEWFNGFIRFIDEEDYLYIDGEYTPCMLLTIETDKRLYLKNWVLPVGLVKYDKIYYDFGEATDSSLILDKYFVSGNMLYFNGILTTGYVLYDDKLYLDGILTTGYVLYDDKLYLDGTLSIGYHVFEDRLYFNGILSIGLISYDNKLYNDGKLTIGLIPFEGRLYNDGLFYENQTQLVIVDELNNDNLYVYGLLVENAVFPKTSTSLKIAIADTGFEKTSVVMPDLSHISLKYITDTGFLFDGYNQITSLSGISSWDVGSLTNIERMFRYCNKVTSLDPISNWDVSNVTNMGGLFGFLEVITEISALSNWDFSKVTTTQGMFYGCVALIDLNGSSNWDMRKVTTTYNMFASHKKTNLTDVTPLYNWILDSADNLKDIFLLTSVTQASATDLVDAWKSNTENPYVDNLNWYDIL